MNYWMIPAIVRPCSPDYVEYVKSEIEAWAGVPDITERTRRREVCEARQVACYILRLRTNYTTTKIGAIFGIDHASVTHSVQTVCALLANNREFRACWQPLIDKLKI